MNREGYLSTINRPKQTTLLGRGYSTEKKYTGLSNYSSANTYLSSLPNSRAQPATTPTVYSNYLLNNSRPEDRKKADIHKVIDNLTNINVGRTNSSSSVPFEAAPQRTYIQLRTNASQQDYSSKDQLTDTKLKASLFDNYSSTKTRPLDRPEDAFQSLQSFSSPERKKTESRTYFDYESAPAVSFEDISKQNELLNSLLMKLQKVEKPFTTTDYSNLKREVFFGALIEKETLTKDKKDELASKELTLEQLRKELAFLDKYQADLEQTRARYQEQVEKSSKLAGASLSALQSSLERLESCQRPAQKPDAYK